MKNGLALSNFFSEGGTPFQLSRFKFYFQLTIDARREVEAWKKRTSRGNDNIILYVVQFPFGPPNLLISAVQLSLVTYV